MKAEGNAIEISREAYESLPIYQLTKNKQPKVTNSNSTGDTFKEAESSRMVEKQKGCNSPALADIIDKSLGTVGRLLLQRHSRRPK